MLSAWLCWIHVPNTYFCQTWLLLVLLQLRVGFFVCICLRKHPTSQSILIFRCVHTIYSFSCFWGAASCFCCPAMDKDFRKCPFLILYAFVGDRSWVISILWPDYVLWCWFDCSQQPAPVNRLADLNTLSSDIGSLNTDLGLALSSDEIEYLVTNYQRLERCPTDVELMMFAQANSEHCRHKIFNADWFIDGKKSAN